MSGKLNCDQGDMAITVGAPMDNGLIVFVLGSGRHHPAAGWCWKVASIGSKFQVEPGKFSQKRMWPDHNLRPIRDQLGDDETLEWAGLPKYRKDHSASLTAVRESLEDLA